MPDQKPLSPEELKTLYRSGAQDDISALQKLISGLADQKQEARADVISEMAAILHNVKGQGASFGYPAITLLGSNAHLMIRFLQDTTPETGELANIQAVIKAHLDMIELLLKEDIQDTKSAPLNNAIAALTEHCARNLPQDLQDKVLRS
ncbi:hypothetical protein [Kiloniella sp. b19]|uniref:hypothetical protein n=1 Tax=Kiloniella sp. GXU_MW_B19 TaxID=3141326 RepID=UPI0031CF59B1